jgi:hypothetical protein
MAHAKTRIAPQRADVPQRDQDRKILTTWTTVTPDVATGLLERNTINRPLRQGWVEILKGIMLRGEWYKTHEGIAITTEGDVVDGQHRLWAVVESGVTVAMLISRGVSREARLVIDSGLRRTLHDALRLTGHADVTTFHVALANAMRRGIGSPQSKQFGRDQMQTYLAAHWDAIDFAKTVLVRRKVRGISTATIGAVLARAWYTADRTRLDAFADVLVTGRMNDATDEVAITLRNVLLQPGRPPIFSVTYGKAERALTAYLGRQRLARLYESGEELFPLADDLTLPAPKRSR